VGCGGTRRPKGAIAEDYLKDAAHVFLDILEEEIGLEFPGTEIRRKAKGHFFRLIEVHDPQKRVEEWMVRDAVMDRVYERLYSEIPAKWFRE